MLSVIQKLLSRGLGMSVAKTKKETKPEANKELSKLIDYLYEEGDNHNYAPHLVDLMVVIALEDRLGLELEERDADLCDHEISREAFVAIVAEECKKQKKIVPTHPRLELLAGAKEREILNNLDTSL